jgi:RimJ/RimL family protein N-acetyltransferase
VPDAARSWPRPEPIDATGLTLEPLRVEHAAELAPLLGDDRLYAFMGGPAPTAAQLRARFERQVAGHSPDGDHGWLNWVAREHLSGVPVATVQATLSNTDGTLVAAVAWVTPVAHQGRGYASKAAGAMVRWLRDRGVEQFVAHIHPQNAASIAVAERLGLAATDVVIAGEVRYSARCS